MSDSGRAARSALALGCALALAAFGLSPARATAALSTSVVSASAAGPNAAMTEGDVAAACAGGPLSGGGARVDQSVLSNGTHLVGSFPTPDGAAQSADGERGPATWIAAAGIGGQATSGVTTWAYGMCLGGGPTATIVAATSMPGPSGTFTGALSVATCPAGTRLLGGGARTTPGTIGSLKPNGSFPSDAAGAPVVGGANATSWAATGLNGGAGAAANATHAFAICAGAGPSIDVVVRNARVDGPGDPSTGALATASCPAGSALLGGGAYISDHFGLPGSQGDHLTGSFPSDASGMPVTSGVASSWTAAAHTGGTASGARTDTNAWALCASEPVAQPAGAGAEPAGNGVGAPAGGSPPPPAPTVAPSPGSIAGGITIPQLRESMRRQMTPRGAAAQIATLLRKGGARLAFRSLEAGRVLIEWRTAPSSRRVRGVLRRGRAILVARGAMTFPRSGERALDVRLTPAGRHALRGRSRVALTARGVFTRPGHPPIVGTKSFVVTGHAASPTP